MITPSNGLRRRTMLKRAGVGGVAMALAAAALKPGSAIAATANDLAVLTFALNLEYLEAEYYLRGVTGSGLPASDTGNVTSTVIGGSQVAFSTTANLQYAEEIASDEFNHVMFLRAALSGAGGTVPNEPVIDFTTAFNSLAVATGLGPSFNPFADENSFLLGAFVFEDVGVTAYLGGASLISTQAYLLAAAGILAVEAYHAGQIRTRLLQLGLFRQAHLISVGREALSEAGGSTTNTDQGIYVNDHANIVPTDANSLAFSRTVAEVTSIVTLGGSGGRGGFFPNGLATQPV